MPLDDPADITRLVTPKRNGVSVLPSQHLLDRVHCADKTILVVRQEVADHAFGLFARRGIERCECLPTVRGQRDNSASSIARRLRDLNDPSLSEAAENPAEIPGVQIEVAREVGRRGFVASGQLEQHAGLSKGILASEDLVV